MGLLSRSFDGCPTSCTATSKHKQRLMDAPCVEKTPQENAAIWFTWMYSLGDKLNNILKQWPDILAKLCSEGNGDCIPVLSAMDCSVIPTWKVMSKAAFNFEQDLCVGELLGGKSDVR